MNISHVSLVALLLSVAVVSLADAQENNQPPEGFVALFNGKDLTGWRGMGHFSPYKWAEMTDEQRAEMTKKNNEDLRQHWRVENGELVNDGHGVYATTEKDFGSIELWIDYKTVPKADSGIYLRGTPQVQIWDTTEAGGKWNIGAKEGSGSLWNNKKAGNRALVLADKPFGEWNRFHIKMVGDVVTVTLNDKLVVDAVPLENFWDREKPLFESGPIQLQTHGGEIRWRNIFVREIDPAQEASQ
ncbi:MAG: DUF1080 domain-containing protein [Planctomycetales bacterium]|nr:DUF1080 domain-containing protein [Planctomycetales bacterium]